MAPWRGSISVNDAQPLGIGASRTSYEVGKVFVGNGVTVGAGSTVLYDTIVSDYARLGPLTLVMKGEQIPAHTEWEGPPAEPKAAPDSIIEKVAA